MVGTLRGESPLPATRCVSKPRRSDERSVSHNALESRVSPMKRIYAPPLIWQIVSSRRIPLTGATISSPLRSGAFTIEALQSSPEEIGAEGRGRARKSRENASRAV